MIDDFLTGLRGAAARVLVAANGADLVFVGRSPEPVFFYLLGILDGADTRFGLTLCNVSLRCADVQPAQVQQLRRLFAGAGIHPGELVRRDRRAALVDVVASGGTFGVLAYQLQRWAADQSVPQKSVHRRLQFIGLTHHESSAWTARPDLRSFRRTSVRLDWPLWAFLGNSDPKVAPWHPPERWYDVIQTVPERTADRVQALAEAQALIRRGQHQDERAALIKALNSAGAQRSAVLRHLIVRLRDIGSASLR
ncbi:hypothetical protein [uncultured Deinococcus sp.]|uniref:hypothetical protein n=1 Tax=uncultured Deinococcus sp. TaxID=158789 RepID=UPI0025D6D652|nr:hypothetical protein [uncultured Deinococcus sp.]